VRALVDGIRDDVAKRERGRRRLVERDEYARVARPLEHRDAD
jgi:hypothetical protein